MNRRRSGALCLLVLSADAAPPCWHRRNSPRTALSNKCVRQRLHDPLRHSNRRSRSIVPAASFLAQMFSSCRRRHSKQELRWKSQAEQVEQEERVSASLQQLAKSAASF